MEKVPSNSILSDGIKSIDFELLAKKKMVTVDKPAESVKPIKCEIKSDVFSLTVQDEEDEKAYTNKGYAQEEWTANKEKEETRERANKEFAVAYNDEAIKPNEIVSHETNCSTVNTESRNNEKGEKPSSRVPSQFRWNILFNLVLWIFIPLPLWLPMLHPYVPLKWAHVTVYTIQGMFTLCWLIVAVLALVGYYRVFKACSSASSSHLNSHTDEQSAHKKSGGDEKTTHLVCMATYKEPLDLLDATIQSLARQTQAQNTVLVVGMEQRTPDKQLKEAELRASYDGTFRKILFPVHPYGTEGEIPGKCSNNNYALRCANAILEAEGVDTDSMLVTTCDADNKFHPRYLELLADRFRNTPDPHSALYQAPLLYNWGLDELSAITRVTGIIRTGIMLGAMIPFNINTMSVFSFSGKLMKMGDYVHPAYQMDDIICLIRFMGIVRKRLRIVPIPVFILSGPTSGRVLEEEIVEWVRQARRWAIGAGEVFHYFVVKSSGIPMRASLSWGFCFTFYYCILLSGSALFSFVATVASVALPYEQYSHNSNATANATGFATMMRQDASLDAFLLYKSQISLVFCLLIYAVFATFFFIDWKAPKLLDPRPVERICLVRNLYHLAVAPFVLLAYSLVQLYALHELLVRGKTVCKHGASKKQSLAGIV